MTLRVLLPCAAGALLLGIAAPPAHAQSEWPPDDDPTYTIPPQHDYPLNPQQPAYTQQPGSSQQYSYAQPDPNQPFDGQPSYGSPQPQYAVQPLSADRLTQIVAPIALYPDALVAQVLTAATYPAQVAAADQWLRGMQGAPAEQIAAAANAQAAWDPSIKALTAFPDVLGMLASNLQWTSELGNAYYNQPQDVLGTVQMLRDRAQQAGNLQPAPQEEVTNNQGYIAIAPANPQVVYVPAYNPWAVYGQPIDPYPGFAFADGLAFFGTGIQYGIGFMIDPWLNFSFGLASWGLDWIGNAILFNHEFCWTHSHEMRDWGYRDGGPRWRGGGYGYGGGYGRDGYGGGRQWARLGDYNHQPIDVHGGDGNGRRGRFPDMRPANGGIRGGEYSRAYGRQSAYNRMPTATGRPQPYSGAHGFMGNGTTRPIYGGSTYGAPRAGSGSYPGYGRPGGTGYGGGNAYSHAPARPGGGWPQSGAVRAGGGFAYSGGSPYQGGRGGYSHTPSAPSYGGGSHSFFGGGHAPSYGGGNRSFNSGGSHSFFGGGGGSHSYSGGGHSFGGGGGHSFGGGGGHSFGGGGGHSFGGGGHSSGGGHSDGGGHRR